MALVNCEYCGIPEAGHRNGRMKIEGLKRIWICEKCDPEIDEVKA